MKKIIGSKMALKLARKEFGERAYVARVGKRFEVGIASRGLCFSYGTRLVQGSGKSWAEALMNAGIVLPIEATIAGEVHDALFAENPMSTWVKKQTDTDAKEPDNGNE